MDVKTVDMKRVMIILIIMTSCKGRYTCINSDGTSNQSDIQYPSGKRIGWAKDVNNLTIDSCYLNDPKKQ